jgi:hypothetical protein
MSTAAIKFRVWSNARIKFFRCGWRRGLYGWCTSDGVCTPVDNQCKSPDSTSNNR